MTLGSTAFKYGVAKSWSMSEEHRARVDAVEARLLAVRMEIDDDDEDVLEIEVEMINEAAVPLGGLETVVRTSDGRSIAPIMPISSLGPGAQRPLHFEVPLGQGSWTFGATCMACLLYTSPSPRDS